MVLARLLTPPFEEHITSIYIYICDIYIYILCLTLYAHIQVFAVIVASTHDDFNNVYRLHCTCSDGYAHSHPAVLAGAGRPSARMWAL